VTQNGRPGLDIATLGRADWVLTTYETLRDYDRDFGQVQFAAAIFDEAQKIKTPGIRLTDAAKGMNARFPDRADRHSSREPPIGSVVYHRYSASGLPR
jgi:hypothetical protein